MKHLIILLTAALFCAASLSAQEVPWSDHPAGADSVFFLPIEYTDDPGDNGIRVSEEVRKNDVFANVTKAKMKVYLPKSNKPTSCVVIFPGGGYEGVWVGNVGTPGADFFTRNGIAAAVVKYRLPNGHIDVPIKDGHQAIKMVRAHAREWNINPDKVGICGSSAGGHLASMLAVHYEPGNPAAANELDRYSTRPDFVILMKAVIDASKGGTMSNSLGDNPSEETKRYCVALNDVTPDIPPTFIAHCYDDQAAPCNGIIKFCLALKEAGVPVEMHLYAEGGHGIAFYEHNNKPFDAWMDALIRWPYLTASKNKQKSEKD